MRFVHFPILLLLLTCAIPVAAAVGPADGGVPPAAAEPSPRRPAMKYKLKGLTPGEIDRHSRMGERDQGEELPGYQSDLLAPSRPNAARAPAYYGPYNR